MEEFKNIFIGGWLIFCSVTIYLYRKGTFTKKKDKERWDKKLSEKTGDSFFVTSIIIFLIGIIMVLLSVSKLFV